MLKAWSIRSNADLFDYLSQRGPASMRQLVNSVGAQIKIEPVEDPTQRYLRKWLVSIKRTHGSKHVISVTQTAAGLNCTFESKSE
jgi:hypothetical protein